MNEDFHIRPMRPSDLPAALALQERVYPAFLVEPEPAFASRLRVAAPYCLAAEREGRLIAYLLAHAARGEMPPPVGAVLPPSLTGDVLFLHDLAVSAAARGSGAGRMLVEQALARAAADGRHRAELIAVEGAAAYWRRLGFVDLVPLPPALAEKVAAYGAGARWMWRAF